MAGVHPIENLMKTTMENLQSMVDVNTVVGEPVETKDGIVIIPVSRVSFGFVAGGGDETADESGSQRQQEGQATEPQENSSRNFPFIGGSGAGVTVRPVGFLVVGEGKVRFLPVSTKAIYDRILDSAPQLLERLADIVEKRRKDGSNKNRVPVEGCNKSTGENDFHTETGPIS